MSEERPRRSKTPEPPPHVSGYRQTRRASRAAKSAKRAERNHAVATSLDRSVRGIKNLFIVTVRGLGVVGVVIIGLLLVATTVNTCVRWSAVRTAEKSGSADERERLIRENVLVIGVNGDKAVGFLAMRVDGKNSQVFGIAIPDGAFVDVPGLGFERIGESYAAGTDVALSTVSNYLGVPFRSYLVVPQSVYSDAVSRQSVAGLATPTDTNLTQQQLKALASQFAKVERKNVGLVPLPVRQIKLGDQTYFEPQRDEVADLLKSWWGVSASESDRTVRVIVYNGAGKPGIAGEAAQLLIRAGFRVVSTENADNFKYDKTRIVVRRGERARGEQIKKALGTGVVTVEPSKSNVTDAIVIIGKDFKTPADDQKGDR